MSNFIDSLKNVWLDGHFVESSESNIPFLTHGLHYASCVYEGIRFYNKKAFKLEEHIARLFRSAEIMDMEIPFDEAGIIQSIEELIARGDITNGYIRPVVWRGSDSIATFAPNNRIHVGIAAWEWPSYYTKEKKLEGIRLGLSKWKRPNGDTAPIEAKASGHYMTLTLSKHQAMRDGYDDAILLDTNDAIAEATSANIFFSKDGELHTPKLGSILDGITRQAIFKFAKSHDIPVIERDITLCEISTFDEAFITGTACEVTAVKSIKDHTFNNNELVSKFIDGYAQMCGE
ncbi:branched-chain amino acid transaminase [Pseudoalteromonas aurantia]|uniref:Branched-chain-amino-acid aminotransferase n=1 Tax=Pseudoalteromonas aurantia 208 TaxID=1314867 RepID=A0ABR9EG32_9GAMM|nr:branched-chain amino acid transaminase [Pseudoalteromonas aurantia]MBE0369941.1 hypothetical protein [Pseudoalteromonas aurantia 208]